jgi:molybdopterin-guanine dinucleotide biosynthesis protein A
VLAGGQGRRLGGDKAVVQLDGHPLLAYPLAALRAAVGDVAVAAKRATALPPLRPDVEIWLEADEPRHPMAGVVRALRGARGRPVLAVAVDLPFAGPDLLRAIAATRAPRGAAAVVPRAGGRLQPLCARYEPEALKALADFDPAARATDLALALDPLIVDIDEDEAFLNINAPEDLLRASALLHGRSRSVRPG